MRDEFGRRMPAAYHGVKYTRNGFSTITNVVT